MRERLKLKKFLGHLVSFITSRNYMRNQLIFLTKISFGSAIPLLIFMLETKESFPPLKAKMFKS